MTTKDEAVAAAKRAESWRKCCELGNHEIHEYWEDTGLQVADQHALVCWAVAALTEAATNEQGG